jgi:hypothetical protein
MEHRIDHDLQPELARKAIAKAIEAYTERFARYQPDANWVNPDQVRVGFTAKGIKLSGDVRIEPRAIVVDFNVPLLLRPFKGKAIEVIEQEVKTWIQRAREGQV